MTLFKTVKNNAGEQVRKIICYGRMPQHRQTDSGLFSIPFKEDGFDLDLDERYLLFNGGARTQTQSNS